VYPPPGFDIPLFSVVDMWVRKPTELKLPIVDTDNLRITHFNLPKAFCKFDFSKITYLFNPIAAEHVGLWKIQGQLSSPWGTTNFAFKLNVINDPPEFVGGFLGQTLKVPIDTVEYYKLPETKDNEGLKVSVATYEKGKRGDLPRFVRFDKKSLEYEVEPTDKNSKVYQTYTIVIELTDAFGKSSHY
jgi:hypothetical protein